MKDKPIGTAKLKTYIDITRITIVICWISLFAFWAIKLFGGNFFEIVVQNENFIKFSDMVQNTWVKYLVSFITIAVAKYFTFGAICQKFTFKGTQLLVVLLSIIMIWTFANFCENDFLQMYGGYIIFIAIGAFYQKGWKKTFGLLAIVFEVLFNVLSVLIRGLELSLSTNYLIIFIGIFDMYIMTVLYYLYSNLIKLIKETK
jgi:hypothetical protein